jgi:hypothetical protein
MFASSSSSQQRLIFRIFVLLLCTQGGRSDPDAPRPPQNSATAQQQQQYGPFQHPWFSWSTVPLYWYASDPKAKWNDTVLQYAASHAVVVPNGNHLRFVEPSQTNEEEKLFATARRLHRANSSTSILFYLNSMIDWEQYDLHATILTHHPEYWITNTGGDTVCLLGQPLFNQSIPQMRQLWLDTVQSALETDLFAGIFADRANQLPKGHGACKNCGVYNTTTGTCVTSGHAAFVYDRHAYTDWTVEHNAVLAKAQALAGDNLTIVVNNNASVGVRGRHFERWCRDDYDQSTIVDDISQLQSYARDEQIALVHGGEPCDAAGLSLSLSAFLIGAGQWSYFGCTDAWYVDDWMQRPIEYDLPLGVPLGLASRYIANGMAVFERHFASGTRVTLHVEVTATHGGHGCIFWSTGHVTGDSHYCSGVRNSSCNLALTDVCASARLSSVSACLLCAGRHQHPLRNAGCGENDVDRFCHMSSK